MKFALRKLKKCHIWKQEVPDKDDLNALESIKTYGEGNHSGRYLHKCLDCGQLYFNEFYEHINWDGGDDKIYVTWIPVKSEKYADKMMANNVMELLGCFPRIQWDSGKDPVWIRKSL